MRGGIFVLVGALGLTATSAKGSGKSNTGCSCTGTCQIKGDPHVLNIWGDHYTEKHDNFLIYKQGGFAITAAAEGQYFVQTINFGSETVSVKDCSASGKLPKSKFENGGVTLEVKCTKPTDKAKYGNNWHLDSTLDIETDTDLNSVKATGVCMERHASDNSSDGTDDPKFKKSAPWHCDCTASCSVKGDPHLLSFYGKKELLTNNEFTVYKLKDFSITAKVNSNHYMTEITVSKGKKTTTYSLDQCGDEPKDNDTTGGRQLRGSDGLSARPPFHPKTLAKFNMNVSGGSVKGEIKCDIERNGNGPHSKKGEPMLNFFLDKSDDGNGMDFSTMEIASGSSGVCTEK